MSTPFGTWLENELQRQGVSKRALARKLAEQHRPEVSMEAVETYRRTLHKYLSGGVNPTQPMRDAIADALGVPRDSVPSDDDVEESMADSLEALARDHAEISRRLKRALRAARA